MGRRSGNLRRPIALAAEIAGRLRGRSIGRRTGGCPATFRRPCAFQAAAIGGARTRSAMGANGQQAVEIAETALRSRFGDLKAVRVRAAATMVDANVFRGGMVCRRLGSPDMASGNCFPCLSEAQSKRSPLSVAGARWLASQDAGAAAQSPRKRWRSQFVLTRPPLRR